MEPHSLSIENQLDLFYRRGMILSDKGKHIEKLEHISYYRLKEFARPFASVTNYGDVPVLRYKDISFDEVVKRYYQDKNLRIRLLHAIEKIEVSVKGNLAYVLGERYGAFGYLDFSQWTNKRENSRYKIEQKQFYFKKNLLNTVKRSTLSDLKKPENLNSDGFPAIWLTTEVLMFGELVNLITLLSVKNLKALASYYNCTGKELISWLKCLNFARNVCAHNANIIDIQLQTKPMIRKAWQTDYLYHSRSQSGSKIATNRLAVIILITLTLVKEVNGRYSWKQLQNSLMAICRRGKQIEERNAHLMGFTDVSKIQEIFNQT